MSIRDEEKKRGVVKAEDRDAKKTDTKVTEEPGPDFRRASGGESKEEHALTTDSPRWGEEGTSEEERGYPREGGEDVKPRE